MLVSSIFSFSHNVFYHFQKKFNFSVTFILSSANAFYLDQSKILLFGTELKKRTLFQMTTIIELSRHLSISLRKLWTKYWKDFVCDKKNLKNSTKHYFKGLLVAFNSFLFIVHLSFYIKDGKKLKRAFLPFISKPQTFHKYFKLFLIQFCIIVQNAGLLSVMMLVVLSVMISVNVTSDDISNIIMMISENVNHDAHAILSLC